MKIRFYVNALLPRAKETQAALAAEAKALGLTLTKGKPEVLIALGGDGTILRAVHEYPGVPILGLNLGGLGYLSGVGPERFTEALQKLAQGQYQIYPRTMLKVRKQGGTKKDVAVALNEVMVMHEKSGHAVVLDVASNQQPVTRYLADGLVVATPTGSTAYSLSAGGPVLMPDAGVVVLTPLNPHALGARPVVTKETVQFAVTARARPHAPAETIGVYADGVKAFSLAVDETAEIEKATETAQLVKLAGYNPFEVLSNKLGWCGMNTR